MNRAITVVQYWAGCPASPDSKWRRFLAIVQQCRDKGWRNYLVWSAMPANPELEQPFRDAGCEIIVQPRSRGNFDVGSVCRTYHLLRRLKCDVFHCYNDHTSPLIGASLARVPVRIWSKLAMSPYYEQNVSPKGLHWLALSSRISCALSVSVLARSKSIAQELSASVVSPGKIVVAPTNVDISLYRNPPALYVRRELGYSQSDVIITTVGHAVPVKGWDLLLSSFECIARERPEAQLVFVGKIPSGGEISFAESLRNRVERGRLNDRVRFLGQRDDVPAILSASDVFVLPSRSEGQPVALVEAMAAGLPCVAARAGGIPEVITDGRDGLLVGREDTADLTQAIGRLLADKTLRRRLREHARLSVERFDLRESTRKLCDLYTALLVRSHRMTEGSFVEGAGRPEEVTGSRPCVKRATFWEP